MEAVVSDLFEIDGVRVKFRKYQVVGVCSGLYDSSY